TRITPWRSMLAAALDQVACQVISAEVEGEEFNPSVELLAMWLAGRLGVTVRRTASIGPGLTAVRLETDCGPIVLDRPDGSLATLCVQGQPDRAVALKRRETAELIAEELRRLDPDDTYAAALRYGVERLVEGGPASDAGGSGAGAGSGADSGAGSRADSGAPDPGAADSGAPDSGAPDSGDAGTGAADSAADGGSGAGAAPAAKSGGKKAPAKKAAAK
ncbi:glucose-6-phosphate dehydrogenase assembly protein OpcA, partial [Streptomyces fradiae]